MDTIKVLWVDLRFIRDEISFNHFLTKDWAVSVSSICDTDHKLGE